MRIASWNVNSLNVRLPHVERWCAEARPDILALQETKLDLARAYMDMGDPDGARSILEEVLSEGNASQKQEAQRLMESIR